MIRKITFSLTVVMVLSACSRYRGGSIEGYVFDAADGRPLEGVIVVAFWELESGWHGDTYGVLRADESLTDDAGYFHIPAWDPVWVNEGALSTSAPMVLFFKSGYQLLIKSNSIQPPDYDPEVWESEYNGKRFALLPFEGDIKEYAGHISHLKFFLKGTYSIGDACYWEKIPVFTRAVLMMQDSFNKQGIYNELPSAEPLRRKGECRNPQELLGGIK
ncbi:MAG TPA: hypothetical protein VFX02_12655 [Gammaproteobacteria bacterium]|nr:hypothetical protein [Gammaproteobacteria bacterium]